MIILDLQARLLVPETVLQQIISLNSLDMELYRHAESIFLQQEHHSLKGRGAFMAQQQQKMINTVSPGSSLHLHAKILSVYEKRNTSILKLIASHTFDPQTEAVETSVLKLLALFGIVFFFFFF